MSVGLWNRWLHRPRTVHPGRISRHLPQTGLQLNSYVGLLSRVFALTKGKTVSQSKSAAAAVTS